jgi:HPt (histidine-containing phosphotransfer) domain-containing protein
LDILESFCKDAVERADEMEICAAKGDYVLLTTLAHALKGASRGIGAEWFGDFAARMEDAAKNADQDVIAEKMPGFQNALRHLTAAIQSALKRHRENGGARASDDQNIVPVRWAELKSALSSMDIHAVNTLLMEFAELPMTSGAKLKFSEVEQDILMFEYDAAIQKIEKLLASDGSVV